jgi:hypothetical protein
LFRIPVYSEKILDLHQRSDADCAPEWFLSSGHEGTMKIRTDMALADDGSCNTADNAKQETSLRISAAQGLVGRGPVAQPTATACTFAPDRKCHRCHGRVRRTRVPQERFHLHTCDATDDRCGDRESVLDGR